MKLIKYNLFISAAFLVLLTCSTSRLSGPSTEEGNPQIVAFVVDTARKPVSGATVIAYRIPENIDSTLQPLSAVDVAQKRTDTQGECSFYNFAPGRYSLAVSDSANNRSALKKNIALTEIKPPHPEFTDTIFIATPGVARGVVSRGGILGIFQNQNLNNGSILVKIGEIDRFTITGPDGSYIFSNLPRGSYTIYYYASDGFYSAKRENITVQPGDTNVIDTVVLRPVPRLLPPKAFRADYDTAASIVRLSWQKVQFDSLRWYEVERIRLTPYKDTVMICQDTVRIDTLNGLPSGTDLNYVVRSVDKAFNRSANAGPVKIQVR